MPYYFLRAILSYDRIRKAYRRKALELHPDRNLNDTENATRKFAEVQTAYEILSDPQERAWYDSHRDAILEGDDGASGGPSSDQRTSGHTPATAIFSLMGRFNSSVPMTDSSSGFFGILNRFFDQIASEETATAEWDGLDIIDYPAFGLATDDFETVAKPFYRIWSSFSTRKSFNWMDKYRLGDAPDRRVRRLMEKENKKFREDGIREFNDAVQSLVAFVRKRDPRYVPNTQSEAERQQVLRNSAAAQAARSRAAHQEKVAEYTVPEWVKSRDDGGHAEEFSMSEEESEVEHIECVVCGKVFKSEKQFEAHEKSKKHIKAVQQLQRQMKRENAALDLQDGPDLSHTTEESMDRGEAADSTPLLVTGPSSGQTNGIAADEEEPNATFSSESGDDEYAARELVEERISTVKSPSTKEVGINASVRSLALGDEASVDRKIGKAKLKREKKAARQVTEISGQESVSAPYPVSCVPTRILTVCSWHSSGARSARKALLPERSSFPTSRNLTMLHPSQKSRQAARSKSDSINFLGFKLHPQLIVLGPRPTNNYSRASSHISKQQLPCTRYKSRRHHPSEPAVTLGKSIHWSASKMINYPST